MNRPLRRNPKRVMADTSTTHGSASVTPSTPSPSPASSSPLSPAPRAQGDPANAAQALAAKREAEAKAQSSLDAHGHAPITLGTTKNGVAVMRRHNEHTSLSSDLLREAIEKAEMPKADFSEIVVEMGRVVGESHCVPVSARQSVLFLRREARAWRSKFVVGLSPVQSSTVVLVLKRGRNDEVFLVTAYVGEKAGREVGDPKATTADRIFWEDHALRLEAFLGQIAQEDHAKALDGVRSLPSLLAPSTSPTRS